MDKLIIERVKIETLHYLKNNLKLKSSMSHDSSSVKISLYLDGELITETTASKYSGGIGPR